MVLASGCTSQIKKDSLEKQYVKTPPLNDPFIPVNIVINPGDWVTSTRASHLGYLRERIEESGIFIHTSASIMRYPVTVELRYEIENTGNEAVDFAETMVSAATLLVVPAQFDVEFRLEVQIYQGPIQLFTQTYKVPGKRYMTIFSNPDAADRPVIDALVELMKSDFDHNPPLPRVREMESSEENVPPMDKI